MIPRSENHEVLISGANQRPHIYLEPNGFGLRVTTLTTSAEISHSLLVAIRRMDLSWARKLSRRIAQ